MKLTHTTIRSAAESRGLTVLQVYALVAQGKTPPLRKSERKMAVDTKALSQWCKGNPKMYEKLCCKYSSGYDKQCALREYLNSHNTEKTI